MKVFFISVILSKVCHTASAFVYFCGKPPFMKSRFVFLMMLLLAQVGFSQDDVEEGEIEDIVIDSLYREDQFYFGINFNLLLNSPEGFSQSGFSGGLQLGAIRDMPINKRRNLSIGVGVGWAIDTYGQNLFIGENEAGESVFAHLQGIAYETNRFSTQSVELPIEFRWRSSTPVKYKFWRVYAGARLSYIYYFKSNFNQKGYQVVQNQLDELNRFQAGASLSVGNSKVNFYFYYSLIPVFDAQLRNSDTGIDIHNMKIGLIFYLL